VCSRRLEPGIDRLTRQWLDPQRQATAGHYDTATGNLNETDGKVNNPGSGQGNRREAADLRLNR
jgi:hypothetical protein